MTHPYRTPSKHSEDPKEGGPTPERGLLVLVVLLWLASVVRFVAAFVRAETFGLGSSLAALTVFGIPVLLWRGRPRRPD